MRFLEYLNEEYETTLVSNKEPYTVYKNPNIDDFKELAMEIRKGGDSDLNVRALVDLTTHDIHIWDANRAIHAVVLRDLVSNSGVSNNTEQIQGIIKNNKFFIPGSSDYGADHWIFDHKLKTENWLKVYFTK
jgi:hypothetical protein